MISSRSVLVLLIQGESGGFDNWAIQIYFSCPGNLKFDWWPRKATGNLFHAPRSFVCHFIAIHEFKLQLLSGSIKLETHHWFSAPFALFLSHRWSQTEVTALKPQCGSKLGIALSCVTCKLGISSMPPNASFVGHRWIQTGVTAWKRSIRIKTVDCLARVTCQFDRWLKKIGHLFYALQVLCIIS